MCAHDDPPVLSMMLCRCGRLQAGCRCPVRYPGSGLYIRRPFAFVGRPIGHGSPVTSKTQATTREGRHGTSKEEIERREPDSPTELSKPSLMYVLRKTAREFSKDQCTDLAAALTYYAVLALFPAAIALVSLILVALVAMALVLTGPAAEAVGNVIGLGSTAVLVWDIAKWPVILAVVVFIVAVVYYATPHVKQPKVR